MQPKVNRQAKLLEEGKEVLQETRRYDDKKNETISMRLKTDSVDYKYYPEGNITPIKLSDEFIKNAIDSCPELAESKKNRYINEQGLNNYDASLLVSEKAVSDYYDEATKYSKAYKLLANWINVDVAAYLNKNVISISEFPISPERLAGLVKLVEASEVNSNQAREIFAKMLEENVDAKKAKEILGISSQISDLDYIKDAVNVVLEENPQAIIDYKEGKGRALGFLVGQIMKKTQGKINPKLTSDLLLEELKKR